LDLSRHLPSIAPPKTPKSKWMVAVLSRS